MDMYISKFEISNYRSCNKTSMDLNIDLSALIGVNGSGKSNFLNGILLLKRMARAHPRYSYEEELSQSVCKIKSTFIIDNMPLQLDAKINYVTNDHNIDQVTNSTQSWNFSEFIDFKKPIKFPINRFIELREVLERDRKHKISNREWKFYISRYLGSSIPDDFNQLDLMSNILRRINGFLTGISYYSASQFTDPSKCPTYFEIDIEKPFRRLSQYESHRLFLFNLYDAYKNPKSKFQEFLSIVGNEGIGLIDKIEFLEIVVPENLYEVGIGGNVVSRESRKILVVPNFFIKSIKLSPNQLSEGTFKTLAMIFYLVTNTSKLLILEEPEVCIHHGLLTSVLELIKEFSQEKQIIISTHSDFVLDELSPQNVFIVKYDTGKGTNIKHVSKALSKSDFENLKIYLKESGNLGEYWRHGDLEI